jgi:integrase
MVEEAAGKRIESSPSTLKQLGAHMARQRKQQGWISIDGGQYVGHWDVYIKQEGKEIRRNRQSILGKVSKKFPEWRARERLERLIREDPCAVVARPDPRTLLEWFYLNRFKPLAEGRWRDSTRSSQPYVIEKHILGRFGDLYLNQITRFDIQTWLNSLCRSLSRWYVQKIRNLFHTIMEEAIEQEYVERNPVAKTRIHKEKDASDRYLTLDEIARLERLEGRERLVFHMMTLLGLRPGELFARRWRDWQQDRLSIPDDVWRGAIDQTKTENSKGFVSLPQLLRTELETYRRLSRWTSPDDFIFCSHRGIPLDAHNYLRRVFRQSCRQLGVEEVTFQCFRRTCSTYLVKYSGGTIKDAQAHLRHANATTTLQIYTKTIPDSVRAAVEELSLKLFPQEKQADLRETANARLN